MKVCSSQFNYQYGDQIHFPYSIASLVSYIQSKEYLKQNFKFEKTFVFREQVEKYISDCKDADILLCSCYVWNWEISIYLAQEVKKLNPNCTIIFGGPQIPNDTTGIFEKYPFIDILVHNEGEIILENTLNEYLKEKNYLLINGISTKDFKNPPEPRINDLDLLPSPYLTNVVWDLVDKIDGIKWICSWETNRGCPYQCTFCDWGSATFTKMRQWTDEKLFKEIEWFSENKINYIDCCDSNFGFFQRDLLLARKLKEQVGKTGYPETFRQSWAKNSSEKIIPIAKELQEKGLLTAVGLAVESLDENTLKIIKRANIKFKKFSDLTNTFRENGLPTFTELIRGLPGETLTSFKNGLEHLIADSKIDTIYIYNCTVLPNAPLNEPSYRDFHKIETVRSPIYLGHSSIHNRGIEEYEYITTGASSYSLDDIKEMYLYSWMTLTLQSFGVLEDLSTFYNKKYSIPFMTFYGIFLEFCRTENSIFSEEYQKVNDYINDGYSGNGWNHYDPKLGEIYWPIEEATWLRLASNKDRLLNGISLFLKYLENKLEINTPISILNDLSKLQIFLLTTKDDQRKIKSEHFEYDWKTFFMDHSDLKISQKKYYFKNLLIESNDIEWGFKAMWYGRRGKSYKFDIGNINEEKFQAELSNIPSTNNKIKPPP